MRRPAAALLSLIATVALTAIAAGCGPSEAESGAEATGSPELREIREALTFYASFDGTADADYAQGEASVFSAPSWSGRSEGAAGLPGDSLVVLAAGRGLYGDALEFVTSSPSIVFFRADGNVAHRQSDWSGTISFWLSLDPDEDLAPGYSDPIQISPRSWNDAALFVDFTRDDTPRKFRFAAFADYDVWNPADRDWADIAPEERPMIEIAEPPFAREHWTHVVLTFERFNTGQPDGRVTGYLDGEPYGTLAEREQTFTWDLDETIVAIGLNYVGRFDELSLYDRALEPSEVAALYQLEGGVAALL